MSRVNDHRMQLKCMAGTQNYYLVGCSCGLPCTTEDAFAEHIAGVAAGVYESPTPPLTIRRISAIFYEGELAAQVATNEDSTACEERRRSPYPRESVETEWWERGFAYWARYERALVAEKNVATLAAAMAIEPDTIKVALECLLGLKAEWYLARRHEVPANVRAAIDNLAAALGGRVVVSGRSASGREFWEFVSP
jgi:hypothetical protein